MSVSVIALPLAALLIAATAVRLFAVLRLLHRYKVEEFGTMPQARRLLLLQRLTMLVMLLSILGLSWCSKIWWIEACGTVAVSLGLWKLLWAARMRHSGAHVRWYEERHWS